MLELQTSDHQERRTLYTEVILPVPVPRLFTYRLPYELNEHVQVGSRVLVPFGRSRLQTGIVERVHEQPPEGYTTKYVLDLLDEEPIVQPKHLRFWQWVAEYYLAPIGDVMNAAVPSGLKLSSHSKVQRNPLFRLEETEHTFNQSETAVLMALKKEESLDYSQLDKLLQGEKVYSVVKSLLRKEAILIFEEVKEKYKPKYVKRIRLTPDYTDPETLSELLESLQAQARQSQLLMQYLSQVPVLQQPDKNAAGIEKSRLLQPSSGEKLSTSSLKTLIKNGVLEEFQEVEPRFAVAPSRPTSPIELTETQERAVQQVFDDFEAGKPAVLLHGVTGSGKTEIYIRLIQQALRNGTQVLFLLPEIALTTQIVARLQRVFGDQMGVYHSRFSDNERVEVWQNVSEGRMAFVAGVRSAVFLPFDNLGLIIVDEEHDPSYKQFDPSPRYNARDLSLVISHLHGAKVVLGSATPSLESYFLAEKGTYGLVSLSERFGNRPMPEIVPVDLRRAKDTKQMKAEFTPELVQAVEAALSHDEQVILFQNRRGYAPFLTCQTCGWIPKCGNCSVSLTYHLGKQEIRCHYCGHHQTSPQACASCGSTKIKSMQFGTEKLEDDLKLIFPDARTARMDRDTTRTRSAYERIIRAFEQHEVDILVGTQMVSKGLDFERVNLVGVFDADRMLHFPDFRAFERTFQLITQVSGRAGRHSNAGRVLVQTYQPEQPILKKIREYNYLGFFQSELREREKHFYPPYSRVIKITSKHEEQSVAQRAAVALSKPLIEKLGTRRILGPEAPLVDRIRNRYLFDIIIKLEREGINLKAAKAFLQETVAKLEQERDFRKVQFVVDVDFM